MKEELQGFKTKKRTAKLVISSSTSLPSDNISAEHGNSPKHGRKTGAETKGRRIDFEDEGDLNAELTFGVEDLAFEIPLGDEDVLKEYDTE